MWREEGEAALGGRAENRAHENKAVKFGKNDFSTVSFLTAEIYSGWLVLSDAGKYLFSDV